MTFVGAVELLFAIAAICGCAWLICHLIDRFDRAADRTQPAYLELSEVEILARLERELDHRKLNAICRAYGERRWAR